MNNEQKIISIIKIFEEKYGYEGLSDGNCGMFSLALYNILKELGMSPSIGLTYEETQPESVKIKELSDKEANIHHVFIEESGKWYDCTGLIDRNYLVGFSEREYGVDGENVGVFTKIDSKDPEWKDLISVIKNDTNWKISSDGFYDFYKNSKTIKESISKYPNETYFFYEDFGFNIGIELKGDASDRIRKSTAESAKTTRIIPWLNMVKSRLIQLGYLPMPIDVVFTSKKIDGDNVDLGYAVMEDNGNYYFVLNVNYLTGIKSLKDATIIDVFVHEWSHIWLFRNSNKSKRIILTKLLEILRNDNSILPFSSSLKYALEDDEGDELWAYLNYNYKNLPEKIKKVYWRIREISS